MRRRWFVLAAILTMAGLGATLITGESITYLIVYASGVGGALFMESTR